MSKSKNCHVSCQNPVVIINNKSHDHYGKRAVIQHATPKMYHVRLLDEEIPLMDRIQYNNSDGRVRAVTGAHIVFTIRKNNVKHTKETAESESNTWQEETMALLVKYEDKTRKQVEQMLKK